MRSVQITDTVFFKHKYITMPTVSKADAIVATAINFAQILLGEVKTNMGEKGIKQLKQLVEMLHQTATNMAEQQSKGILNSHGQWRVKKIKGTPQQQAHLPKTHASKSHTD